MSSAPATHDAVVNLKTTSSYTSNISTNTPFIVVRLDNLTILKSRINKFVMEDPLNQVSQSA